VISESKGAPAVTDSIRGLFFRATSLFGCLVPAKREIVERKLHTDSKIVHYANTFTWRILCLKKSAHSQSQRYFSR
jgi:hypothetical protein